MCSRTNVKNEHIKILSAKNAQESERQYIEEALALHAANLSLIPITTYDPVRPNKSDPCAQSQQLPRALTSSTPIKQTIAKH